LKRKLYDGETAFGFSMAIGFALLSISPLHEKAVYETLERISEIVELHPLFGEFDILVKIECNDIDSIGGVVINKIRSTKGVMDTKTLIGTKSLSG
jgi:DNA-binding Lrp family transcriptional regulator